METENIKTKEEQQEKELWIKYKTTGDKYCENQLVRMYMEMVKREVHKMPIKAISGFDYNDFISCGIMGLLEAIREFDLNRKNKFRTYAVFRIRGFIIDEMRKFDFFPRTVYQKAKEIESVIRYLEEKLGRTPREEEIAEEMNLTVEAFRKTLNRVSITTVLSLDEQRSVCGDNDKLSLLDTIESPFSMNPDVITEQKEIKKVLTEMMLQLPEKERAVLKLYYYEELTLKEIGAVLNVTESRVSQLHSKAVLTLRAKLSNARRGF